MLNDEPISFPGDMICTVVQDYMSYMHVALTTDRRTRRCCSLFIIVSHINNDANPLLMLSHGADVNYESFAVPATITNAKAYKQRPAEDA